MIYHLNSILEVIQSPVIARFEDPALAERRYGDGKELVSDSFEKQYMVASITAVDGVVIILLRENDAVNSTEWTHQKDTLTYF